MQSAFDRHDACALRMSSYEFAAHPGIGLRTISDRRCSRQV
jgi:hypothetical protein